MSSARILAISGSLRAASVNSAALRVAAAAAGIPVTIDEASVRELPPFDPDLEADRPPRVLEFDAACLAAPGLLISVPEYAHGIPGAFKNALDWTVGSGSLYAKPVAVLDVAPAGRGGFVREALGHVLGAMQAEVAWYAVPIAAADRDPAGEIVGRAAVVSLGAAVRDFAGRIGLQAAV
jgi:chromate reductase, NAD(P)H dehydrogenase (quinone)